MEIKGKSKSNKKTYFWKKVLQNWRNKEFKDFVIDFNSTDIIQVQHLGELYPDKLVYCIPGARNGKEVGFFALLYHTLNHLSYADFYNLTPVISWREDWLYKENRLIDGTDNVFEYYFQPVSEVTYKDVNRCRNVVPFLGQRKVGKEIDAKEEYRQREQKVFLKQYGELYSKYCKLNPRTKQYVKSNLKIILEGKKTLGVHIRGTDFKRAFDQHPVYISAQDYVEPVKRIFFGGGRMSIDKYFLQQTA